MKIEIEVTEAAVASLLRQNTNPAPSLRLPVTTANRALLRLLRTAEQSAWEAGQLFTSHSFTPASRKALEHRFV